MITSDKHKVDATRIACTWPYIDKNEIINNEIQSENECPANR